MRLVNRFIYIFLGLFCAGSIASFAQNGGVIQSEGSFLRQLQKRDSVLIADQLEYGVELKGVSENTQLMFPDYSKQFIDSVEVVSQWKLDTIKTVKSKHSGLKAYDLEASIVITSFDEGDYNLPPLAVRRILPDGVIDTLVFNPQKLSVTTIPVDTTTFQLNDIKGQVKYPITFKEVLPYILGALALLLLIYLIYRLIRSHKGTEDDAHKEPAYVVALRKLDKYRGNKYWSPDKQKTFYSGITDALREYIVARFGVDAMEMTTAEIFSALKGDESLDKELYQQAKDLFEKADLVKFAKFVATDEYNATALPTAVRFVTETYQSMLEEEQPAETQETEETDSPETDKADEDLERFMPKGNDQGGGE